MSGLTERFAFAVDLALEAGTLALHMRQGLGPADAKSPIDFCTEADLAVERLIRDRVTAQFGDTMIGEEDGGEASDSVWVVDPIDGTTGYIHGTGRWCVSLAYMRKGTIEIGVLYAPVGDRLFTAQAGQGAFLNGRSIQVSHLRHQAVPVVETGWSERRPLSAYCALLTRLNADQIEFRRHGSGALGLADVAAGLNDAYVELHINSWDALAGILLVREAGGYVKDFLADDGLNKGNLLFASTPELVDRIMPMLREV